MTDRRQALGRWGEERAASYLHERGYEIVAQNYRTPYGEIDLIAQGGGALVFVEVKARTTLDFGHPEEAITEQKRAHMIDAAQAYLQENPEVEIPWRIDVIAIQKRADNEPPEITHFENAIF